MAQKIKVHEWKCPICSKEIKSLYEHQLKHNKEEHEKKHKGIKPVQTITINKPEVPKETMEDIDKFIKEHSKELQILGMSKYRRKQMEMEKNGIQNGNQMRKR